MICILSIRFWTGLFGFVRINSDAAIRSVVAYQTVVSCELQGSLAATSYEGIGLPSPASQIHPHTSPSLLDLIASEKNASITSPTLNGNPEQNAVDAMNICRHSLISYSSGATVIMVAIWQVRT